MAASNKTLQYLRRKQMESAEFRLDASPYRAVETIGTGAYGVVCKAVDERSDRHVAVKKIPRAFAAVTLIKRTLREVRILRNFRHENIVAVLDMFQADGRYGADVYMVMDLMETDLHQIIHSKQALTDQHFQYFLYQILRGLKYIHSAGVIHRDLKPSNLLVNSDCLLKIGDFGMARSVEQGPEQQGNYMTQYVATRWYRAPELLFSMLDYSSAVDMWSVACIFCEMIERRQLFPGKDPISQVKMIVYYLGTPEHEVMERISSDLIKRWIDSCGVKAPLPWNSILPKASPAALDLVARLMPIAPWRRLTAADALAHPYLATYHDANIEPSCPKRIVLETDAIESMAPDELKAALSAEVVAFAGAHTLSPAAAASTAPANGCADAPTADADSADDDVIMLSARFDDSLEFKHQQAEAVDGAQPKKPTNVKEALRNALSRRKAAAPAAQPQPAVAAAQKPTVTAHTRFLERAEKRKKREEKQTRRDKDKSPPAQDPDLTQQDEQLLRRWGQMQTQKQIADIIKQSFPSPLESDASGCSSGQMAVGGPKRQRSAGRQLDSAQLMDAWLQATNMNHEQMHDLQREIAMTSPSE